MDKVLIIATSRYTRGGITAVINAQQKGTQWKEFHCKWIGYHVDRSLYIKLFFLAQALIHYLLVIPFYQIVHLQFSLTEDSKRAYIFFKIAKGFHKKTIIHLHCGDQLPEIWSPIYEEMFTKSDLALVLSPSIKSRVEEYIGTSYNIKVLYNPCPQVDNITPFDIRKKEILFAGTLNSNKGYSDLIKGFARIASKCPDWKVVFAGNGEIDKAKAIARQENVLDQCVFLGWVNGEQKDAAFRSASILCLASFAEGFPMAVLDAWAYGVPVVVTPAGGLLDIIKDGENGLLFGSGDIVKLAVQLDKMISNEEMRRKVSKESKIMAETTFNIDTINKQLWKFYSSLSKS